jgi:polyferredoxin
VQVCPTGIDIRNGLQLECIGCAACVDACDDIMTKLKRPTGLVRYDSHVGLHGGKTTFIRPRIIFYTFLLLLGMGAFLFSATRISPLNASAVRMHRCAFLCGGRRAEEPVPRACHQQAQQPLHLQSGDGG